VQAQAVQGRAPVVPVRVAEELAAPVGCLMLNVAGKVLAVRAARQIQLRPTLSTGLPRGKGGRVEGQLKRNGILGRSPRAAR
jgi:hypothetical protein